MIYVYISVVIELKYAGCEIIPNACTLNTVIAVKCHAGQFMVTLYR